MQNILDDQGARYVQENSLWNILEKNIKHVLIQMDNKNISRKQILSKNSFSYISIEILYNVQYISLNKRSSGLISGINSLFFYAADFRNFFFYFNFQFEKFLQLQSFCSRETFLFFHLISLFIKYNRLHSKCSF